MLQDETNIDYEYLQQPIYSGARVSVLEHTAAIMQYAIASSINYASIGQLLKLLQVLCPPVNLFPKSFYKVQRFLSSLTQKQKYKRSAVCAHASLRMD